MIAASMKIVNERLIDFASFKVVEKEFLPGPGK